MATVKGERIATNLIGRVVTSPDPRVEERRKAGWPIYWAKPPAQTAEEAANPALIRGRAEVVAVFLRDGQVRLLLSNPYGNHPLYDAPASDWQVIQ